MSNGVKTIIFIGDFTLGEKLTDLQIKITKEALKRKGDLAIIVNDIDFSRKLFYYYNSILNNKDGLEGVKLQYKNKKRCGSVACVQDYRDIKDIVDEEQYKYSLRIIKDELDEITYKKIKKVVRDKICLKLVYNRINEYGLNPRNIKIYNEKQLRNRASERLKGKKRGRATSWYNFILEVDGIYKNKLGDNWNPIMDRIISRDGTPFCGSILLALYEILIDEGYSKAIQLDEEKDRDVILNAMGIYNALKEGYDLLKTKNEEKEFSYEIHEKWKRLEFENLFFK